MSGFLHPLRPPDRVTASTPSGTLELTSGTGGWKHNDVCVAVAIDGSEASIGVAAPESELSWVRLKWRLDTAPGMRYLGDHWERGYGDFEWRGLVPERPMPWYFLATDGKATYCCGVKTGANAICSWSVDDSSLTLTLDLHCGGCPVALGQRTLNAATVVTAVSELSPFAAAQDFCRRLCDSPILPSRPVYGGNNWYYAYGVSSHAQILEDTRLVAELAGSNDNRPYMVIDDGWQISGPSCNGGPWRYSNRGFPDMPGLAAQMSGLGVDPGIWVRPLLTVERVPHGWTLPNDRPYATLDPTVEDALEYIKSEIRTVAGWGYRMIKHDFSTFDIFGRWGFQMGPQLTKPGWSFADKTKTTAEVILHLYRAIREAAGDATIIGCNTVGHLAAGHVHIQRTGDDTSGRDWERTRKMGMNTLAFRMPQHNSFFAADADCAGITKQIPWPLNRQWLDLLARSGTPLFVSASPDAMTSEVKKEVRKAFALASKPQPPGEPLDWLDTTCPRRWLLGGVESSFDWYELGSEAP